MCHCDLTTTRALGEEEWQTTLAVGEEDPLEPRYTTAAVGEECPTDYVGTGGGDAQASSPDPFGGF